MLSMKVSTLRYSYLNKSNRVGLVPRGLSITQPTTVTKKGKVKIVYLKLVSKKQRERERGGRRKKRSIYFTGKVTERCVPGETSTGKLVLCYMEILRASCFRDKKPFAIRAGNRSLDTRDDGSIFIRKWKGVNAGPKNATRETS